ncbi:MAG: YdcF family protein [Rhodobacteraceae bacterium]|nr:YdcF family protein [Paracoccaceae bacterium]
MSHAIVILGAAMRGPGMPGPALIRRARHGADLWQTMPDSVILASGGMGEAEAITAICRAAGVPEAQIVQEPQSRNTAQNIAFSAPILAARSIDAITLVTDYYHLPRARLLARRAGLAVTPSAPPHGIARPHRHVWLVMREAAALLAVLVRPQR